MPAPAIDPSQSLLLQDCVERTVMLLNRTAAEANDYYLEEHIENNECSP